MSDKKSQSKKGKGPDRDDDDDDGSCNFDSGHHGFDMGQIAFIRLVDALIEHPKPRVVAAGRDGATSATSELFWTYTPRGGLHVEARAGFMDTQTGNGGFSLDVERDGSWRLDFGGSSKVIGRDADGNECDDGPSTPPPPPADNGYTLLQVLDANGNPTVAAVSYGPPAHHLTVDGGITWDTIQGGIGAYMIGGSGTAGGGQDGKGNCAIYTQSPGSILVDMEHGVGYGGNAESNILVNMNQVRGSLFSNVLIGAHTGSDMKSGGDNSLMISTGGDGFEMRPDGRGNVMVSTAGDDWILFDPSKGWSLGDDNIMLGFDGRAGGDFLDLTLLTKVGGALGSNFHTTAAAGYDSVTGHGDIDNYVRIVDSVDGSHVMFNASGNVATAGTEILALKFAHGLDAQTLFDNGGIRA